ncbi:MAG: hypothetical protein HYS86_01770 [Candidatus Chisholmbacteria bacterium]|nr:hypothetical protein [Candidatus Chisholmbacteria bacterium]
MLALILVLLQLIVLIGLWRQLKEVQKVRKVQEVQKAGDDPRLTQINSDVILTETRRTARQIMEEAYLKAQAIVAEGKDFRQGAMRSLSDKLEVVAKEELTQFRQALREAQAESVNSIQNVSKSIESKVSQELFSFHETLREETLRAHQEAEGVLKRELGKASEVAENYKKEMVQKVDEQVFELVALVVKKVMREGLSAKEHEEMVMEALAEAKKQKLL